MKRGQQLWNAGAVLLGLLILGGLALVLNRPSDEADPDSTSYAPGGARAFAALLEREGYAVSRTDLIPSQPVPDTLLIAFPRPKSLEEQFGNSSEEKRSEPSASLFVSVTKHLLAGWPAMLLKIDPAYDPLREVETVPVTSGLSGQKSWNLALSGGGANTSTWPFVARPEAIFTAWKTDSDAVVNLFSIGEKPGSQLRSATGTYVLNGAMALNENLDKADNASFLLQLVRSACGPHIRKVLFVDGAFTGSRVPGLLDVLGPWSKAAWAQFLLVMLVLAWAVSIRFGLPTTLRSRQSSSRSLLDGVADTLERSRQSGWALDELAKQADQRIRARLGLVPSASNRDRDSRLPQGLSNILQAAENPPPGATEEVMTAIARSLDQELNAWLVAERVRRG